MLAEELDLRYLLTASASRDWDGDRNHTLTVESSVYGCDRFGVVSFNFSELRVPQVARERILFIKSSRKKPLTQAPPLDNQSLHQPSTAWSHMWVSIDSEAACSAALQQAFLGYGIVYNWCWSPMVLVWLGPCAWLFKRHRPRLRLRVPSAQP